MSLNISREVALMKRMTTAQLRDYFQAVCKETPRSRNRDWMTKRITWRLQANAQGGLPERVRQRALQMPDDAELRTRPPIGFKEQVVLAAAHVTVVDTTRDPRLPPVGDTIRKKYKGQHLVVQVVEQGFEFNGEIFTTISAVAKAISGSHVNGFAFFDLKSREERAS